MNEEFYGLDAITLSRWLNGKTIPPLHKQMRIAICLGIDLAEFILDLDLSSASAGNRQKKALHLLEKSLDFSTSSLSYQRIPQVVNCKIEKQSFEEHFSIYRDFHENIPALKDFFKEVYSLKDKINYMQVCLLNHNKEMIGHYCGVEEISKLKDVSIFNNCSKDELSRSCFLSVGYFSNSRHYLKLISYLIAYYCTGVYKRIDYLYLAVAGYPLYLVTKQFLSIDEWRALPPKDGSKIGVFIFKIDIVRAICNPQFLPDAQKKLECLSRCHIENCGKCNLLDYL